MTLRISTGLANRLLDTGSMRSTMAAGNIKIYTGTEPANADAAATGTLLCTVTINSSGTGINFDTVAAAGVLAKTPSEIWSGVNAASGVAAYFRHVAAGDTAAISSTQPRLQGNVGVVGADLNLTSVTLTAAATQVIDFYTIAQPLA